MVNENGDPLARLLVAHGGGSGVGEQVNEDVLRVEVEQVEAAALDRLGSILGARHAQRFDRVNPERFDDCVERLGHFAMVPLRLRAFDVT